MGWDDGSPVKTVLKWALAVIVAVAVLRLALWALGVAWSLGTFLLFTVGPIVLVGWLALKLIGYFGRDAQDTV